MSVYKGGAVILAVGVLATALSESITHDAKHHEHTPGTYFGTLVSSSTSAATFFSDTSDLGMHRAYYPHPIEMVVDRVREYIRVNPVTFVLP